MIKDYNLFLSAKYTKLINKAKLRIDLIGNIKISEIKELKKFNILYLGNSFDDFITIKGFPIKRKVRYIQIFNKVGD